MLLISKRHVEEIQNPLLYIWWLTLILWEYNPVFQWTSALLIHILENLLELKSKNKASQCHCCMHFFMLSLKNIQNSLLVNSKVVPMEKTRFSISRKIFMVCIKVLAPSGNILLKVLAVVTYPKILLITASLYEQGSHFHLFCWWSDLLGKVQGMRRILLIWLPSYKLKVSIRGKRMILLDCLEFIFSVILRLDFRRQTVNVNERF